jgi:hypothetical protein
MYLNLFKPIEKMFNLNNQQNMKALKITLILALFFTALTSCTKQELSEDDVLVTPETQSINKSGAVLER